jgi:hypothetical protein
MPKPLSDDLRCRILRAYLRQVGSQAELGKLCTSLRPASYLHKLEA